MIRNLLSELNELEVRITTDGKQLLIQDPNGHLGAELMEKLRVNKNSIIDFLLSKSILPTQTILPIEDQEYYELSHAQYRMWVINKIEEDAATYNTSRQFRVRGIEMSRFKKAYRALLAKHSILCTNFISIDGNPKQVIKKRLNSGHIVEEDFSQMSESFEKAKEKLKYWLTYPFDLENDSLIRTYLCYLGGTEYLLGITLHHIISDGWSMEILLKDLMTLYSDHDHEGTSNSQLQYKDYAAWQNVQLAGNALTNHKDFWLEQFQEEIPVFELPGYRHRPAIKTYSGNRINELLGTEYSSELKLLALNSRTTLFTLLLSTVKVLMHRLTTKRDNVVGIPVAGRNHFALERQIGLYMNLLPLRSILDTNESFINYYKRINDSMLEALEHQVFPFDNLVSELDLERDMSRSPLFDVMVAMRDATFQNATSSSVGLDIEDVNIDSRYVKYDFQFSFYPVDDQIGLELNYNSDIYDETLAHGLVANYKFLLQQILSQPSTRVADLLLQSEQVNVSLDALYPKRLGSYTYKHTMVELFERLVERQGDKVAIGYRGDLMSYERLNEESNKLAHYLRERHKVGPNQLVGIRTDQLDHMLVGLLGILKSGAAYLPIDPNNPTGRLNYIIQDATIKVLLVSGELKDELPESVTVIPLSDVESMSTSKENLQRVNQPSDVAYAIYTSGSTGMPKGVLINHESVCNYIGWLSEEVGITNKDSTLLLSSFSFDLGYTSLWGSILLGGSLYDHDGGGYLSIQNLIEELISHEITYLKLTPSHMSLLMGSSQFVDCLKKSRLRVILLGGESIRVDDVVAFIDQCPRCTVFNHYGPTETTIGTISHKVTKDNLSAFKSRPVIGRAITNNQVFIVDELGHLQSVGIAGEVCITGAGLYRGYLNRPELTKDKSIIIKLPEGELQAYRSGDLGILTTDGTIEFLGRIDNQIKIRGYRIEMGEILSVLDSFAGVTASAIKLIGEKNDRSLVAYVAGDNLEKTVLENFLAEHLTSYMIPSHIVIVERIPLTKNGKINYGALPDSANNRTTIYEAPKNIIEEKLATIWKDVLGREQIGVSDNFFEIGGDSIKAIQVSARLNQLSLRLDVRDIILNPILKNLCAYVREQKLNVDQREVSGEVPLTPIQKQFLDINDEHNHYNFSSLFVLERRLDLRVLNEIFRKIVGHHDALRLVYSWDGSIWKQTHTFIDRNVTIVEEYDLVNAHSPEQDLFVITQQLQGSLKLDNAPPMKVALFRLKENDRLLIIVHHLVVDGISWRILLEDFKTLYAQSLKNSTLKLPLKSHSFKDWSLHLQELITSEFFKKESTYWAEKLSDVSIHAPGNYERLENIARDEITYTLTLDVDHTNQLLTMVPKVFKTEINDILLASLGLSLCIFNQCNKSLIWLESHGRYPLTDELDFSRTVGWFSSIYPVHLTFSNPGDLTQCIIDTKEYLRNVPNNGIGYGVLKYLGSDSALIHEPVEKIKFNYLGQFDSDIKEGDFQLSTEKVGSPVGPNSNRGYDWIVLGAVTNGQLHFSVKYNKHQQVMLMEEFVDIFKNQLINVIEHCVEQQQGQLTPSDLTYKNITLGELKELNLEYGKIQDMYPLSPMQEGFLFHSIIDRDKHIYFNQVSYDLKGELNTQIVQQSLKILTERHSILRTSFNAEHEPKLQIVLADRAMDFSYVDLRAIKNQREIEEYIHAYKLQDRERKFDLRKDPLMRVAILQSSDNAYSFIWSNHHILMDGWCRGVLINEYMLIYDALSNRLKPNLSEPVQYKDYIKWLSTYDTSKALEYWQSYLEGFENLTSIPKTNHALDASLTDYQSFTLSLSKETIAAINQICAKYGVTLNTYLQAVWCIVLGAYNDAQDVLYGLVVSGRPPEIHGIEKMIGLFINTIPVRVDWNLDTRFNDFLMSIQKNLLGSEPYHYGKLADIQSQTDFKRNLFDHILIFENYPVDKVDESEGDDTEVLNVSSYDHNNYDFNIIIVPGEAYTLRFSFNTQRYDSNFIEKTSKHFENVLNKTIQDTEIPMHSLDVLSNEEKSKLIFELDGTQKSLPDQLIIPAQFEIITETQPEAIAIIDHDQKMTYRELNEKANKLAHYLRDNHNISRDDIIGVQMDRSARFIISILGVLKAGGAYVSLVPDLPVERREFMVDDCKIKVLITESDYMFDLPKYDGAIVALDIQLDDLSSNQSNPVHINEPTDLAYVIYTSGSTGNPKGVLIEHAGKINMALDLKDKFGVTKTDRFLQFASSSFDASVYEIFMALYAGASLVLIRPRDLDNSERFVSYINKCGVSIMAVTPSFLAILDLEKIKFLKVIITGGEPAHLNDALTCIEFSNYFNAYGPTECSVCTNIHKVSSLDKNLKVLPIGKPIANTEIFILSEDQKLVPMGVVGEICIGGIGLARGYLNNPQLTSLKFPAHPFDPTKRIYKTGDLGRWNVNGEIEYFGRNDEQIKIRGFRIETGEVEFAIRQHVSVIDVAVVPRIIHEDKELVAYVVFEQDTTNLNKLKSFIEERLPHYMVPSHIIALEQIPKTLSGKINKKQLPDPIQKVSKIEEHVTNKLQIELIEIWKKVLGRKEISINDNFFEIGGHSLKATQLVTQVHKKLNIKMELQDVFNNPTIQTLSGILETSKSSSFESIQRIEEQEYYELSHAQKRIWMSDQVWGGGNTLHMRITYELESIDLNALRFAFVSLITKHESLRTHFIEVDGQPKQQVVAPEHIGFNLHVIDEITSDEAAHQYIKQEAARPFNLTTDPLVRVNLVRKSSTKFLFMMVMHHIIGDGQSIKVIGKEVANYYNLYLDDPQQVVNTKPLPIHYKDFTAWQNALLSDESITPFKDYWLKHFSQTIQPLELPLDFERPSFKTYEGARLTFHLNDTLSKSIAKFSTQHNTSLFITMVACVKGLLHHLTGQLDIIIGTVNSGRDHADIESQIGFYVNILPLRTKIEPSDSFEKFLLKVNSTTLNAFSNQLYPYDELINQLNIKRDPSRFPLFDVRIEMNVIDDNSNSSVEVMSGVSIESYQVDTDVSKDDLYFLFSEINGKMTVMINYNSKLFKTETIELIYEKLNSFITQAIVNPTIPISTINLTSEIEEELANPGFQINFNSDL
jgi:bacitracin synthase 3